MSCKGTCKSFNASKGWGFLVYDGVDVFVHIKDCDGGMPQEGDHLTFDVQDDPVRGGDQLKALNVSGGSAPLESGKGKGKGKGKDGGKGKGGGGKGKGYGKDSGKGY